ncbi:beta-ketoacyl-ACP reductase [Fulvivirgaceae bacterium LMO-SS25]
MNRLKDKVAIITGGARGIGKATAELFSKNGAKVQIWDVLPNGADIIDELNKSGSDVSFKQVNVANYDEVENAVLGLKNELGRIDILINNAGITRDSSLLKMTIDQWQQVINVNLNGVFNCTKAVAAIMKEQGNGRIISASSIVGIYGNFGQTNYVASKSAVIGMTKTWAKELGRYGITVNCIAPGFIETEMTAGIPDEYRKPMIEKIPVKRAGQPQDIANGYLYLASDEASFVNGICLSIDGGAVS